MQYDGPKREDRSPLPIGVFWDIENCQVPRGKSATALANRIRELFFEGHREAEFLCVCDIRKERPEVVQELNLAQVTVVHINATSKNAADDKLKQCMRRYVDIHGSPASLLLISGDVNFSTELSDFRHRQKIRVLLLHSVSAPEALLVCAHECYSFAQVASAVPFRTPTAKGPNRTCELVVQDLPTDKEYSLVHNRLRQLSNNCGGRVLSIVGATAYLRFPNPEAALRASKRMDGEDVFGSLIAVSLHTTRRRRSRGLREGGLRDRSSSSSRSPESSSVEADSVRPCPPTLNTSLSSNRSEWCEENLRNVASFAAEVEEASHSRMSRDSRSTGLFVRCSSQPEVSTGHAGDENDKMSVFSLPQWRTLSPSPDSGVPSSTLSHHSTITGTTVRASSFEGPRTHQHQGGATPGAHFAGSPSKSRAIRAVRRLGNGSPVAFVDVCVTNIDPGIEASELKKKLLALFQEHVMVLHISLAVTPNGCFVAKVRVPSASDARLAMERLQQCRIGECLLKLSLNEPSPTSPTKVASKPLHCALQHPSPPSSSTSSSSSSSGFFSTSSSSSSVVPNGESSRGWAQWADTPAPLPRVCLPRARFAAHMERLLDTHSGSLPLDSFRACYEAEFGPLPLAPRLEPWREGCVPLEHLVASLPGVTVVTPAQGFKQAMRDSPEGPLPNGAPRLLTPELKELSREVVELLCKQEHCSLPLHQFIPAFHRHFGRQCFLADYGCTRLMDLMAAIGHVVEILGQGSTRVVTLTHDAQLGRFAVDVKAVLEDPGSPQTLLLSSLPQRYQDVHRRPLRVADYGVCSLDDLLRTLPKSMVLVEQRAGNTVLMLPERGPTEEEAGRLRELAAELVQLLSEKGELLLSQLSPAYQQKYERKLKTNHYGPFRKLLALLESIPDVVEVYGIGNRRMVRLTSAYQPTKRAPLLETPTKVPCAAGHPEELPQESPQPPSSPPPSPVVVDVTEESMLDILLENSGASLDLGKLWDAVHARCGSYPELSVLRKLEAGGQVTIDRQRRRVCLSPLALLARQLRQLLCDGDAVRSGCLSLSQLEEAYKQKHGTLPALFQLGFTSLEELLSSRPEYFALSGTPEARTVSLADASKRVVLLPKPNSLEPVYSKQKTGVEPKSDTAATQTVSPIPVTKRATAQSSEPVGGRTAVQPVNPKPAAESAATQTVSSELVSGSATVSRPVSAEPVDERAATLPVNTVPVIGSEVSCEPVTRDADLSEVAAEAELLDLLPEGLLDEPIPSGVPSPEIRPELSPASAAAVAAAADLMRFDGADQGMKTSLVADSEKIPKPSPSSSPAAQPARRRLAAFFPV
ncbi:meiosis regulator and mRNA stability factor 1-like isoform X2 [Haemaphysalis longicornis]